MTDEREIVLEEKISLIERKMAILTRRVEELAACLREFEDLRFEIAGLKLFLGRAYPGV
jgi:predicted HTH domain antitoxin